MTSFAEKAKVPLGSLINAGPGRRENRFVFQREVSWPFKTNRLITAQFFTAIEVDRIVIVNRDRLLAQMFTLLVEVVRDVLQAIHLK